jgi:hypothetical protein
LSILWQQRSRLAKQKPHCRVWQWGSINLVDESEPDRRAGKQQRVQQQVQIQIPNHALKLLMGRGKSTSFADRAHPWAQQGEQYGRLMFAHRSQNQKRSDLASFRVW